MSIALGMTTAQLPTQGSTPLIPSPTPQALWNLSPILGIGKGPLIFIAGVVAGWFIIFMGWIVILIVRWLMGKGAQEAGGGTRAVCPRCGQAVHGDEQGCG